MGEHRNRLKLPLRIRLLKLFHKEAIPLPGTLFYNALTSTDIFQRNYDVIADDILGYASSGSLLDIGTGPGWLLIALRRKNDRLAVTGLDISRSMVAKARKNIGRSGMSTIRVMEGTVASLPFPDAAFDIVVSTGSLHHWKDHVEGLDEVHRVLKPGGTALIYDIATDTPAEIIDDMSRRFGRLRVMLLWIHAFEEPFLSRKDFDALARASRFGASPARFVAGVYCLILKKAA